MSSQFPSLIPPQTSSQRKYPSLAIPKSPASSQSPASSSSSLQTPIPVPYASSTPPSATIPTLATSPAINPIDLTAAPPPSRTDPSPSGGLFSPEIYAALGMKTPVPSAQAPLTAPTTFISVPHKQQPSPLGPIDAPTYTPNILTAASAPPQSSSQGLSLSTLSINDNPTTPQPSLSSIASSIKPPAVPQQFPLPSSPSLPPDLNPGPLPANSNNPFLSIINPPPSAEQQPSLTINPPQISTRVSNPSYNEDINVNLNNINPTYTPPSAPIPSTLSPFPFPVKKSASKTILTSLAIPTNPNAPAPKTYTAVSYQNPPSLSQDSLLQQPPSSTIFNRHHHSSSSSSSSTITSTSEASSSLSVPSSDLSQTCDPFIPPVKPPPSPKHPSIFLDTTKVKATASQRDPNDNPSLKIEDTLVLTIERKKTASPSPSSMSSPPSNSSSSTDLTAAITSTTIEPPNDLIPTSTSTPHFDKNYNDHYAQLDVADLDEDGWRAVAEAGDIEELGKLGEGAGGSVTRCRLKNRGPNSKVFALKAITTNPNPEVQKQILRELQFNRTCNSPHIVKYFGTFLSEETASIFIAMEYCGGGSLEAIYKRVKARDGRIGEKVLGKIAEGVLSGLSYLHERKIIHRDIKPQNILLDSEGQVKLCDFGVSGEVVNSLATTFTGTSYYMAPERIQGQPYTVTSDVWSLGLTIMEVAQHRFPFLPENHEPLTPIELLSVIVNMPAPELKDEPDEGIKWSESFRHFLKSCLEKDPKKRASPRQMLMHPWIVGQRNKSVKMAKFVKECWS